MANTSARSFVQLYPNHMGSIFAHGTPANFPDHNSSPAAAAHPTHASADRSVFKPRYHPPHHPENPSPPDLASVSRRTGSPPPPPPAPPAPRSPPPRRGHPDSQSRSRPAPSVGRTTDRRPRPPVRPLGGTEREPPPASAGRTAAAAFSRAGRPNGPPLPPRLPRAMHPARGAERASRERGRNEHPERGGCNSGGQAVPESSGAFGAAAKKRVCPIVH